MSDRKLLGEILRRNEIGDLPADEMWAELWERHPDEPRFLLLNAFEELSAGQPPDVYTAEYLLAKATRIAEAGGAAIQPFVADLITLAEPRFEEARLRDREALARLLTRVTPLGYEPSGADRRLRKLTRAVLAEWEKRAESAPETPEIEARPEQPYAIATTYAAGDRIRHPKFGLGVVEDVLEGKVAVRFDDGVRALVHARKRPA
jgi:hypothetical protein